MDWKKVCDGRGAPRSRVLKMGVKESKPDPGDSNNRRVRTVSHRPTTIAPEKVPVFPKNSARWLKPYDVYICCSEEDIVYAKALLSYLQEQPECLRCFLPMRDMNPGGAIPTEMTEGAESSHCWITLLTSASLSDQWCQYQMQQFLAIAPHGNGRLIPVLVELSFQSYPKELKHMYGFRDAQGDQKVFQQLRKAIISYLTQLPSVTVDQNLKEETNSSSSESGPSSSSIGINSQVIHSQTPDSNSDSSMKSLETQDTTSDTELRSSMTQGSFNITSARSDMNQEAPRDASLKSSLIQDPASNTSESTKNTSSNTSVKSSVNQETISEASQKSSCTQASSSNTSGECSLNQESIKRRPGRTLSSQGFTSDLPLTQVSTCDTFMRRPVIKESTSEPYLGYWSPKPNKNLSLKNYEMVVFSTNTLPLNCKAMDSSTSTRMFTKTEYTSTRKVDSGSCKKEKTINLDCQSFESDVYTDSARSLTRNKGSSILQKNIHSSCGGAEIDKEMLQGNTYISCAGTNKDMDDFLDLQEDVYTASRPKSENKALQSLQINIYTSGGAKTENIQGRPHLSLLSNIYTSSGTSEDVQSFQKSGESKILLDDLYTCCGGMQTENEDLPSHQSDLYKSYDEKRATMDFQSFQTDIYTSSKEKESEKKTSCSFQSDLYTSCQEKNPQGEVNTKFVGLQASNKFLESLQNDIYASSDGIQEVSENFGTLCSDQRLSGAPAQTMDLPALQSNLCTDTQAENKDSENFSSHLCGICPKGRDSCIYHGNVYMNSISTQAVKPTMHTYRGDGYRPASEAADKT